MATVQGKADGAFLTIGELAEELGLPHHILRYWETRFPQLKPLQRAGNRRYYRQQDADLAREINRLLYQEGYTVKGVQKLLAGRTGMPSAPAPILPRVEPERVPVPHRPVTTAPDLRPGLLAIRNRLSALLADVDASL